MTDDLVKRLRSPKNVFYEYAADDGAFLREAADRIEELEKQRKKTYESLLKLTRLHDEVEAKLAKATDVILKLYYGAGVVTDDMRATIAELTGEDQ